MTAPDICIYIYIYIYLSILRRVRLYFLEITAFLEMMGLNWKAKFPFPPSNIQKLPVKSPEIPIPGNNGAPAEMWEPEMLS